MSKRRQRPLVLVALHGMLFASLAPAGAQECTVSTAGPLVLTSDQTLTVCASNLDAPSARRVGVAFYDAFDAREPLRLEYVDLAPGAGSCTSFRPPEESLSVVARAGYVRAPEDPAQPLALSAQVTGRAYALWPAVKLIDTVIAVDVSRPPV